MLLLAVILISVPAVSTGTKQNDGAWDSGQTNAIQFMLVQSCATWARFRWEPSADAFPAASKPPHFTTCEIMYMNLRLQEAKLVLVAPSPGIRELTLENLQARTQYMASITCNQTYTSPTIRFTTGYPCTDQEVEKEKASRPVNTTEVSRRPVQLSKSSGDLAVKDTVLGLLFALCGVTIILCAALYYWKRRRHRQRIQRIFRQSQSDPFLALHSSSDLTPTSSI